MEDEDFLAAIEADNKAVPVAEAATPEPAKDEPKEPAKEPEKAPEPEPKPAEALTEPPTPTEPPIPTEVQPEPKEAPHAPLAALLDERDKRKALEAQLAKYQQAEVQPLQMPDPIDDPEGFARAQQAMTSQALYQQNLQWSVRIASIQHGEQTVSEATKWGYERCDTDPYFNAKVAASPDPIGFVLQEYQREQIASQVTPDDFKQFQAWKAAQATLTEQAAPAAPVNPASAVPPKSLASAPSAGGINAQVEQSEEDIFNEVIRKG